MAGSGWGDPDVGASKPFSDGESSSTRKPELADFLRERMKELRITYRMLEAATPMMKRTRLHSILHSDPAKRRPMLVDEVQAVCAALSTTQLEAWFGTEILGCMPDERLEETAGLAAFMATVFGGLAPRLANTVAAIGGLDLSDVKGEHGQQIQQLVLENFERGYADLAERKGLRLLREAAEYR